MHENQSKLSIYRNVAVILLVIASSILLLYVKKNASELIEIHFLNNPVLDHELKYQLITFGLTLFILFITFLFNRSNFKTFFSLGKINAEIVPVKYLGINPKGKENWLHLGTNFAIVISIVTAVVIYFQVIHGQDISPAITSFIPWAIFFALINSFVEEMIFRFSLVSVLFQQMNTDYILILSGLIFGLVHYFGIPSGIPGVLMAGFLGWFLAKSIVETKGIFWAWLIHFLQDVIIFTGLFIEKL